VVYTFFGIHQHSLLACEVMPKHSPNLEAILPMLEFPKHSPN